MAKKKKANKKKVGKKANRKPAKPKAPKPKGLYAKKLTIMRRVPIMPCSIIGKDRVGRMFAHTQAEKVFARYSKLCQEFSLVISMVAVEMSNGPQTVYIDPEGTTTKRECSRAVCKFRIVDTESGQEDYFWGAALGDNAVWSDNSAQTIAFKQALLQYFFTAWPQPTDFVEVVREQLSKLKGENFIKVIQQIMPIKAHEILTETKALEELRAFFTESQKKGAKNAKHNGKSRS